MKVIITGRKIEVTDALRDIIEKKLGKLDKFFHSDSEARVTLSAVRGRHTMEVTIVSQGLVVRAESATNDMYASLDEAIEALERQLRKNKTRLAKRLREGAFELPEPGAPPVDEEMEFNVVKTKEFFAKPMDVEEAILQMNLLGHAFYLFRESGSGNINLVYRRKDGAYGLLKPE